MSNLIAKLNSYIEQGLISSKLKTIILEFYDNFTFILRDSPHPEINQKLFDTLLDKVIENIKHPPHFSIFHKSVRQPFNYFQFGIDFMRPFVDFEKSKVIGLEQLRSIRAQLDKGENVILFANHQIEPDPQIISLLLENIDPQLASDIVFVAGHRVLTDPMAIPFSLGTNLLCVYSKKHIDNPPENKAEKILHNQKTLKRMQEMLNEGGYCIYVAPSGGRDRPNAFGDVEVAQFDSQSVELFWLMGKQSAQPTHFYPLALQTYHLLPPPEEVEKEVGEKRKISISPVFVAFSAEIDMENCASDEVKDKKERRALRAEAIWNKVNESYLALPK